MRKKQHLYLYLKKRKPAVEPRRKKGRPLQRQINIPAATDTTEPVNCVFAENFFFLRMLSTWPCGYQVHRLSCSSQTCRRVVTNRTRKATLSWNVHYHFFYTFILSITNIFNSGAKCAPWTHARKSSDAEVKWGTQVLHPWSLKDFFFFFFFVEQRT